MASNQEEVKLFGMRGSPFATRVHIALKLKGIEYEYVDEKWGNFSETLIKYNPVYKKVPVLVHNKKPILESILILEYIDEIWKQNPILPSDPYKRAQARFWSKFIDDKILSAVPKVTTCHDEKEREEIFKEVEVALQFLENELKDKFFGGEKIGIVDITASFVAFWLPVIQEAAGLKLFTSEKFPKLYKWSEDFNNHPIVKEQLPPREFILAFFKARFESLAASK
ncbi:probable glutathione S-transferase [Vicia villosa]|uniref:probable glutathione S-transferase n=1 Tax=Vicia villosa TaxID=3911 RepID=UPI00273AB47E|nr:probable glutathione S-transferase [Vicia villosa]